MREPIDIAEIECLASRAVEELLDDATSGRVRTNRELAEAVIGCVRKSAMPQLEFLQWLLNERATERLKLEH